MNSLPEVQRAGSERNNDGADAVSEIDREVLEPQDRRSDLISSSHGGQAPVGAVRVLHVLGIGNAQRFGSPTLVRCQEAQRHAQREPFVVNVGSHRHHGA